MKIARALDRNTRFFVLSFCARAASYFNRSNTHATLRRYAGLSMRLRYKHNQKTSSKALRIACVLLQQMQKMEVQQQALSPSSFHESACINERFNRPLQRKQTHSFFFVSPIRAARSEIFLQDGSGAPVFACLWNASRYVQLLDLFAQPRNRTNLY